MVECPDFTGKNYSVISSGEQYDSFQFEAVYEKSDSDNENTIISQDTKAGEKIKRNSTITLHISSGREKATLPDVAGMDATAAAAAITDAGFMPSVVYSANVDFADGICYGTSPAAGEKVSTASTVTVCVSLGNEKKLINYINLSGKTLENAKELLSKAGLNVGKIDYEKSDKASGTIINQYPGYKQSVEIAGGSIVNLTVAE
jgi:serine/threonine-protein kinase